VSVEPTCADTYVVVKTAAGDVTVSTAPQVAHANWFDTQSGV